MTVHFNQNSMAKILSFKAVVDPRGENYHGHKFRTCNDGYSTKWKVFQIQGVKVWALLLQYIKER